MLCRAPVLSVLCTEKTDYSSTPALQNLMFGLMDCRCAWNVKVVLVCYWPSICMHFCLPLFQGIALK